MAKSMRKGNSVLVWSFQQDPAERGTLGREVMTNVSFALSSNNKDQLRDLHNYLNQKVITTINYLYVLSAHSS